VIEVGRFPRRTDAEFARSLLAAARIPSVLAPEEAAGGYPIDLNGAAHLLVADADAALALVILGPEPPREDKAR
jgi:hypothetical protein